MNRETIKMIITFREFLTEGYNKQAITQEFYLQGLLLTSLFLEDEIILN